ncbi:hypothetical protein GTGU_00607 [Trabulsiella guamensis ATCC 49490]|uniref:Rhs family protein n=1 Tax=Trabulsiella guamensis ATCC 49490 TaxID=1005994 RepID=A0A085AK12_9ENTR|nr:hypothetical protein GTGU_00607 [Trabulsiella guamensis ATCC 49490]
MSFFAPATSLPGFNGERQDPLSGVTHPGNGYRAYSPVLRRFTCPDSESPFGIGGLNPYAYCENDPINKTDPSGHGPITWLIRKIIGLSVRTGIKRVVARRDTRIPANGLHIVIKRRPQLSFLKHPLYWFKLNYNPAHVTHL